jgi:glycosyltransferase involved in cell wall biosynthesis
MKIGIFPGAEYKSPPPSTGIYPALDLTSKLADLLVTKGHRVILFAPKGSRSTARVVDFGLRDLDTVRRRLGVAWEVKGLIAYEQLLISQIFLYLKTHKLDVLHSHDPLRTLPFVSFSDTPAVLTMHTPVRESYQIAYDYSWRSGARFYPVSISKAQQNTSPKAHWFANVYNGIDQVKFRFSIHGSADLLWVGRIHPDKGTDLAIQVARQARRPIKLVGSHVPEDEKSSSFWRDSIKPAVKKTGVHHLGLLHPDQTPPIYGRARVFIFPIRWEEPFGLVVPEVNSCGTPVVAFARGSMPELIKDGVNGFLIKPGDVQGMVRAVKRIYDMPEKEYQRMRENSRKHVEENFTIDKMVDGYLKVYEKVIKAHRSRR